jgi:hypothetical protein
MATITTAIATAIATATAARVAAAAVAAAAAAVAAAAAAVVAAVVVVKRKLVRVGPVDRLGALQHLVTSRTFANSKTSLLRSVDLQVATTMGTSLSPR